MTTSHPARSSNQQFECDFCGKHFKLKRHIRGHLKVHLPKVECRVCKAELTVQSLRQHTKSCANQTELKFSCQICSKTFKTKQLLKNHEKTHNKQFQCSACSKKFPSQSRLNTHRKENHENPRSFGCEECGKKFNRKGNLKKHQEIHAWHRPKPFKCQKCDYSTDMKDHLEAHGKVHRRREAKYAAMKNPVECKKCGKFSRSKGKLNEHMKVVHPVELYQCDLCGRYLKTFQGLKRHLASHEMRMKSALVLESL